MHGVMVWVFLEKHVPGFPDTTPKGASIEAMPILVSCHEFGFSMVNEVFPFSRMQEGPDAGRSHHDAVAGRLHATRRIITATAVPTSMGALGLVSNSVGFVKLIGVGLTLAVLLDAFVIWGLLVPAVKRVVEEAGSWVPRLLRQQPTTDPGERYKIDPQFVLQALERLS